MPYRRYNPLQDKWILTSPQRMGRPWSGQLETGAETKMTEYDKTCYLCPGNQRSNGQKNPDYKSTFVFVNDFSALVPQKTTDEQKKETPSSLFFEQPESGVCEVICYSPTHNKTMASMSLDEISAVIMLWQERYLKLGSRGDIKHVQIFENRGSEGGNSNPHPHGQIWSQNHIPAFPAIELSQQEKYFQETSSLLLLDYERQETEKKKRIVFTNNSFTLLVPFWAEWPYETIILPRFSLPSLDKLPQKFIFDLAAVLSLVAKMYGLFFSRPLYGAPYTMGIHQQPTDNNTHNIQTHFHFQPPMLTPERQKFMVGYERFAEAQRDLTAEEAASQLRQIASGLK